MKRIFFWLLTLLLSLAITIPALAQAEAELQLGMSRDFGYSSGTGSIQGTFSMRASGPDNLVRVIFFIDGEVMAEDTESPYRYQFTTDSYPLGIHILTATGYTNDGGELHSNEIKVEFVSSEEGMQSAFGILGPILGLVSVIILLSFVGPLLLSRKQASVQLGTQRNYGFRGGTICPKCKRPFQLRLLSFNFGFHKLEICPHCRKWSFVRPRPLAELRTAEDAELEQAQAQGLIPEESEQEKLRKELDSSRFQDI